MTQCYVFDIDGTVSDCSHRVHHITKSPKDWKAFFAADGADEPITHMVDLALHLAKVAPVVFVTARPAEWRASTVAWLARQYLSGPVYMRAIGDRRDDNIVKSELIDQVIADGFEPIMAFEYRTRVVKMLRARGIPCAQVAEGDF